MKKILTTIGFFSVVLLITGQGCLSLTESGSSTSGPGGMFVSTDKGEAWQSISLLPTAKGVEQLAGVSVFRIFEDLQDPKAMYWASREHGLFFTYDEGKTWQRAVEPLNKGFIYSVAVHPKNKCTIYATDGDLVYKSEDCSRSWEEVHREDRSGVTIRFLEFDQFNPKDVYLLKDNGDLLKSNDAGESWVVVNRFGVDSAEIRSDPLQENVFYLVSKKKGLYRSVDGGETWDKLIDGLKEYSGAMVYRRFSIHPTQAGVLYWVSTYGVLVSKDSGDTWESIDLITPPGSANIYGFAVNPQNDQEIYYTATIKNKSSFYRSLDGGKNWTTRKLPSGQLPVYLRVHPEKSDIVYLGFTIPPKDWSGNQ